MSTFHPGGKILRSVYLALWFLLSLSLKSQAFAQEAPRQIPLAQERALQAATEWLEPPLTFSGEVCALSEAEPIGGWSDGSLKSDLLCGKDLVGFFVGPTDPVPFFEQVGPGRALEVKVSNYISATENVSCGAPAKLLVRQIDLQVIACRNIVDGWPSLALISQSADEILLAYGAASAFPYLADLMGIDVSSIPKQDLVKLVAGLWSVPVPMGSIADRGSIKADWAAAREASERLDFSAAQARLEAALEVQVQLFGDADFTTAALLLDLAMVLAYQEEFEAAQAIIRRAGPIIDGSPRSSDRAKFSGYQASISALQGEFSTASRFALDATNKWREIIGADDQQALLSLFQSEENQIIDAQPELALALAREAGILLKVGDPVSAYAKASEALFILNSAQQRPPIWRSEILGVLGEASSALGRLSASETFFAKAISLRRSVQGDNAGMVRLLLAQGRAYQREAMNINAIITYRKAIGIVKDMPRGSVALRVDDLIPFAEAVLAEAQSLASEDEQLGVMTELYDAFQMAFVPGRDEAIDLASVQINDADPALAKLLSNLKTSLLAQLELSGKLAIERGKSAAERDDNSIAVWTARSKEVTARSVSLRDTLTKEHPEYRRFYESRAPDLNALRDVLGPDEALVSFLIGRDISFLQLVTRQRIYITPVEAGAEDLARMVRSLRKGLEIEGSSVNEFNLEDSYLLYKTLFAGVSEPLSSVRRIIVVPNGPLSSLPFGTLLTSAPTSEDYRKAPWLVSRMAITHAPSVVSFVNLRSTRSVKVPPKPFLGIANPRFRELSPALPVGSTQSCNSEGIALAGRFDSLEQLPDTIDEVRSVIASLGIKDADLFVDKEAKESVFRGQSLNQYNIIYVATHAVMPGEVACQREPGIALARPSEIPLSRSEDGFLDASEVSALQISANLVVLSACNTATGGDSVVQKGDALSGLAESFFITGARSLLVTHWQVPSAATASLMRDLFGAIGKDREIATDSALRRAQLLAINNSDTAHPFFWGAFSFIGSGQEAVLSQGPVS
ncbi:MAG: CHAT domain-containing protein [Novosphingobium sp.]|nr:CHAT domain-containing protein [Novosphingobium sp.]